MRTLKRPPLALVALLAVAPLAAPLRGELPSPRVTWRSLETPNFKVMGEVSAGKLVEAAENLELFRAALRRLAPGARSEPSMPVTVIVFSHDRTFWPYALPSNGKPEHYAGVFHPTRWGDYMPLVADSQSKDPYDLLYAGYVHEVVSNSYARLPGWFESGLSGFYRTFHLTSKQIEIGRPSRGHLQTMRNGWKIPLAHLIELSSSSPELTNEVLSDSYFAESWAFVHYLLVGDRELTPRVPELMDRLGRGEPSATALPAALGLGLDELDRRLDAYARKALFRYVTFPRGDLPAPEHTAPVELSRAETLALLGEYLTHVGAADAAREHLSAAVEAGVDNGDVEALLGYLAEETGDVEEAARHYATTMTRPVRRVASYVHVSHFELDRTGSGVAAEGTTDPHLEAAFAAASRATELDASCAEAWALRGLAALRRGDDNEAMAAFAQAQVLSPGRTDIVYNRYIAALNAGRLDLAEGIVRNTLARLDLDVARTALAEIVRRRQSDIVNRAFDDSRRAVDEGRLDEALEILRTASSALPDGDARASVDKQLASLEPYVVERKLVDRYQHASTLAQQGKYSQAREEIRGVVADCGAQRVCTAARELLDYLDRRLGRKRGA